MAKDKSLKEVDDIQINDTNLQPEVKVVSSTMPDNNLEKNTEKEMIPSVVSDMANVDLQQAETEDKNLSDGSAENVDKEYIDDEIDTTQSDLNVSKSEDVEKDDGKSGEEISLMSISGNGKLETNQQNQGGNYVPLLKDDGQTCPPLQYRPRSSGAIYGAGYDAGLMQDNSRSVRTKKIFKHNDGLEDVDVIDIKKPKPLWLKITLIVLASIFSLCAVLGIYVFYVDAGFERIYDMKYLDVENNRPASLARNVSYDVVTYNLNYGAFSSDYSYYKSYGYDANGKVTKGKSSRAISKERVEVNTKGSAGLMSTGSNANVEFFMFQEVDIDSTRTYYVNERQILKDVFMNYAEIFAETGSSNYVFSPLTSPVGRYSSGMVTYSAFEVDYAMRHSLPSNEKFPSKYSSTDNCISVAKCPITGVGNGRYLCLINIDISMYDDEQVRIKDLEKLYEIIKEESSRENYVIVGGSFSYLLSGAEGVFENKMGTPDWCKELPECFNEVRLNEIGCRIIKDNIAIELKTGTTRDASTNFKRGDSFEAITDGFIVSSNVIVDKIELLDNEFLYSSHNPVRLTFKLK